jgi:glycosyltransferase involved in cell wall biosynthesis
MSEHFDISAVITTYNRSEMLAKALEALLSQKPVGVRYEVIAVDNNSTDNTRATIEAFIAKGHANLRYVFEPRQGIAHGRNAGIAAARADIIAFTDDDVVVTDNWIAVIKRAFAENPEVEYIGGKILPDWTEPPPKWLTVDHWWPLALLDRGDNRFYVNASNPLCLPTANASFRRELFSRIGLFSPKFSGREDHELFVRLWQEAGQGLYEPDLVVMAKVQPERLLKSYHHRWSARTGKFNSLMRLDEIMASDGSLNRDRPHAVKLFGVPGCMYREFVTESLGWLRQIAYGDDSRKMRHENRLFYLVGYVRKSYEMAVAQEGHSTLRELASFIKAVFAKVVRKQSPTNSKATNAGRSD